VSAARYRLLCKIGSGILADSFRAERDDGTPVVMKLFQAGTAEDRYAREIAEVARRLLPFQVPGICQVIDIGYAAGRLAVVRERHDDFNLGQVLSRMTKWGIIFPTPLALWVICELLDAVRRAHAAGVIHGGIAPGNILLGENGQPSLCDFGALPALCAAPELRARFVPAGRGSYRSQEVERGEAPTQRSDVFSLGAVAYQLLTLREVSPTRPDPTSPGSVPGPGSQLDQRLYPILMRALETIPQLRYPSCADFSEALQSYLSANRLTPSRQELHKLLLDLFPEGPGRESDQERLPFHEPLLLDAIHGIAPLVKPAREPWPLSVAADSSQEVEPDGFSAAFYAPPAGESSRQPASDTTPGTSAQPAPAAAAGAFAAPAAARPSVLQAPADPSTRKGLRRQKALGFAGSLLIAGSFVIALSMWRPGPGKTRPRSTEVPPAAVAAERVERADGPPAAGIEPPLAPAASVQPGGPRAARSADRVEWDSPPSRGGGYLFVSSDVPAVVYVDGRRVREPAPLKHYPVQVGVRKISVVAQDINERRDFIVHFGRGQIRKIDSSFERSSARR
jgi:serine/threonine-protein kinase